jgi:hypothetical protein
MLKGMMSVLVALGGAGFLVATGCGDGDATGPGENSGGAPPLAAGGVAGDDNDGAAGEESGGAAGDDNDGAAGDGSSGAGGDESGAAGGAQGGGAGEAGSPATGGAGAAGEGGAGGAPSEDCGVGRRVQAVFDDTGGSLALCGAEVTMPPGVLDEPRTVSLSIVALPPESPTWLDQAGPAFEVEVEGELPAGEIAPLGVVVPHLETTRYVYLYTHVNDTWGYLEACTREADRIGQEAWSEGVFVPLVEQEDFPTSVTGLGSGSVEVTFDEVTSTFDLDADTIETHAIYDGVGENRSVTLSATKEATDSSLERLRIDFGIDETGGATLIQITYGSTADVNGFWSYLPFHPGAASVELTRDEDDELVGSVGAELTRGEDVAPFSATFDVSVEKYRYPPEGYCNIPEG